jgi:hypothetical protein
MRSDGPCRPPHDACRSGYLASHSSPAIAIVEATTSAYSSLPLRRTSRPGNGSHSQTLALLSARDRPTSMGNTDFARFRIFLTGHFPEFPLRKKRLHSILTSCELAAAIFGASSTDNLRNETASDIIAKPHSPSITYRRTHDYTFSYS